MGYSYYNLRAMRFLSVFRACAIEGTLQKVERVSLESGQLRVKDIINSRGGVASIQIKLIWVGRGVGGGEG